MKKLLHIDASPRGQRSRSRPVSEAFVDALDGYAVTELDLWDITLPELGEGMIEGRYSLIMGQPVDADIAGAWDEIRRHADAFLAHDAVLLAVPMWNFGLPYRLKHYIDVITQPGMAFTNDAVGNVIGGATHMKAMTIAASAMPFGKDDAIAGLDFQATYLDAWMDFIGMGARELLRVSPTFGDPEQVEQVVRDAARQAAEIAARF